MTKFIKKIAVCIIMSILIAGPNLANAQTPNPAGTKKEVEQQKASVAGILDDAKKNPCIELVTNDGKLGPDAGFIITQYEEPLHNEEIIKRDEDDNIIYQTRNCFRNHFSITTADGKDYPVSILSKICSKTAESQINNLKKAKPKLKPTFGCDRVQVVLTKGGATAIEGFISQIFIWASSIVGIIAVSVIIINAMRISASGGDSQAIEDAKKSILQSLAAIAILFLSGLILYTINPTFFTL